MRIIFAGTPDFALPVMERLAESRHEISAVITQPDKPSGRGQKVQEGPVKIFARERGIPVLQPEKLKNPPFVEVLKPYNPDLIIVIAYGKILPKDMLELPRYGCINIHASLLPRYRGAAPINRAIINEEQITGVTLMKMAETLDTGEILLSEQVEILDDDDTQSLGNMISVLGAALLIQLLDKIEETGELKGIPQDETQASYAPKLTPEDCILDWTKTTHQISCKVRGLCPKPVAVSRLDEKIFKIHRADIYFTDENEFNVLMKQKDSEPGKVVKLLKGTGPVVRTGDGFLNILKAQPPGKNIMSGTDLINGGYIKLGSRFQ
jgi:methionyl-tRNA formyltransferase